MITLYIDALILPAIILKIIWGHNFEKSSNKPTYAPKDKIGQKMKKNLLNFYKKLKLKPKNYLILEYFYF